MGRRGGIGALSHTCIEYQHPTTALRGWLSVEEIIEHYHCVIEVIPILSLWSSQQGEYPYEMPG